MKIITIGPAYPFKGGIAHYNNWLCNFLSKKHSVECISFKRQYPNLIFPGKSQRDKSAPRRTRFRITEILDSINPFTWNKTVKHIIDKNPDYVLLYWWTPYFAFMNNYITERLSASGIKIIYLCHNVLPHEKSAVDRILARIALKHSDYFIVHAKKEKNDLKTILPKTSNRNITVTVHPSYDVQFKFGPVSRNHTRKSLKLTGNVILFFGFVRDYKGLKLLLKAMPAIIKRLDVTLMIVGEFWKGKEEYLNMIEELGIGNKVRIIDKYIPDKKVAQYYVASDLVVLPYLSATNSGIVQIAYGFNRPVVVTKVGGLPEVVADGKTGFVVKPESPAAIADAVVRFFRGKKRKNFEKYIKKEKYRFSWDRMVETFEEIDKRARGR